MLDMLGIGGVVDLPAHENDAIAHINLLPMTVGAYLDSADRISHAVR